MSVVNLNPIAYQILVDDKKGNVYELPTTAMRWKTERKDRAGSLEFDFVGGDRYSDTSFQLNCGDIVRLEVNGEILFYGYVFTVSNKSGETFSATAYDQIRYLMYNDTYVFTGKTATEIIKQIAVDKNITLGTIAETGYAIPKLSEDNKKLLDIIDDALSETTYNTSKTYVLYDNAGALTLTALDGMRLDIALTDTGILTGYDYQESIDNDTYNKIKLVRDNEDKGCRDIFICQDSANISKWGTLQYYGKVDSGYNDAMINQMGKALLALKNRQEKSFKLDSMGDVSCRAGKVVYIEIAGLGVAQYYVIESAEHKFEGNDYTMDLTLKVVG